jgi:hypothetical protein
MILKRLRRSCLASLLGLLALLGNGVALTQLNGNVIWAVLAAMPAVEHHVAHPAGHHAEDHMDMADSAHGAAHPCPEKSSSNGGHTNRGHGDCALCGQAGALAAITLANAPPAPLPRLRPVAVYDFYGVHLLSAAPALSYQSRAPPALS